MATERESLGTILRRQVLFLALGVTMAAAAAYVAYHGLMATMKVVIGTP